MLKPVCSVQTHRGVGPERTLATVPARGAGGAGVLAEVVVARDGLSAQVAHEAAAAARHPVAALRLHQARPALHALPDPGCRHALLAAAQRGEPPHYLQEPQLQRSVRLLDTVLIRKCQKLTGFYLHSWEIHAA